MENETDLEAGARRDLAGVREDDAHMTEDRAGVAGVRGAVGTSVVDADTMEMIVGAICGVLSTGDNRWWGDPHWIGSASGCSGT